VARILLKCFYRKLIFKVVKRGEKYYSLYKNKLDGMLKNDVLFRLLVGTLLVSQLVEARRNKPEGRGFDSQWCQLNFLLT
jgi:hypothetical protein